MGWMDLFIAVSMRLAELYALQKLGKNSGNKAPKILMTKEKHPFYIISGIGKISGQPEASLQEEFIKRLNKTVGVIDFSANGNLPLKQRLEKEEKDLLSGYISGYRKILLAIDGKQYSSREFADRTKFWEENFSGVYFIIGGSDGVSNKLQNSADEKLSLGKMTFPHIITRIILLEQLYRARCINTGHPYHK
jgi:23S rRNA (pseudouridine1915-N3)-methyltransferase